MAWGVVAVTLAAAIGAVVIGLTAVSGFSFGIDLFVLGIPMLAFPVVGALIVSKQPENRIGRLLLLTGSATVVTLAGGTYADVRPGPPGVQWVAWVSNWAWVFGLGSLGLVLLLFPDGRLPSSRWRIVWWINTAAIASLVIATAFTPGPLVDHPHIENPLGVEAVRSTPFREGGIGWFLIAIGLVASAAALVARFRRARGHERTQLKGLTYAAAVLAAGWFAQTVLYGLIDESIAIVLFGIGLTALPIAAGIAILKQRLFDIDIVIRKTVLYGSLAAFLIGVYVVVGTALGGLIGRSPTAAVIAAAVFGLAFHPVSRVARRFANRVVYGKRASPYEVLSEFAERMGGTLATEELVPRMARILAEGTGAARADVWLRFRPQASRRSDLACRPAAPTLRPHRGAGRSGDRRARPRYPSAIGRSCWALSPSRRSPVRT